MGLFQSSLPRASDLLNTFCIIFVLLVSPLNCIQNLRQYLISRFDQKTQHHNRAVYKQAVHYTFLICTAVICVAWVICLIWSVKVKSLIPIDTVFTVLFGIYLVAFIFHGFSLYKEVYALYPTVAKRNKAAIIGVTGIGVVLCFTRMVFSSVTDVARVGKVAHSLENSNHW